MTSTGIRTEAKIGVLVTLLLLGIGAIVFAAEVLPPAIVEQGDALAERIGHWVLLGTIVLVLGAYTLWRIYVPAPTPTSPGITTTVDTPPSNQEIVGEQATEEIEAVVEARKRGKLVDDASVKRALREATRDAIRGWGYTESEVEALIETGEWTDHRVAASFVGGVDAPSYPILERLIGWLLPGWALERRINATLGTLESQRDIPEQAELS